MFATDNNDDDDDAFRMGRCSFVYVRSKVHIASGRTGVVGCAGNYTNKPANDDDEQCEVSVRNKTTAITVGRSVGGGGCGVVVVVVI